MRVLMLGGFRRNLLEHRVPASCRIRIGARSTLTPKSCRMSPQRPVSLTGKAAVLYSVVQGSSPWLGKYQQSKTSGETNE